LLADEAYSYNHPPLRNLGQLGYKHRARANVVFFDGHAAATALRQTNALALKF